MNITKIGHCCLQIDVDSVRILTDPGAFSDEQNSITDIDAVLVTHEHADHLHSESLQAIMANNPDAEIYTNSATGAVLGEMGVDYTEIQDGDTLDIKGVKVQTWNVEHADIYEDVTPVLNTALFINDILLYPGDAFFNPGLEIDTLALPAEGPWMKTSEAIDYALEIKPHQTFPVHDARLDPRLGDARYGHYKRVLEKNNITWHNIDAGDKLEIQ